MKHLSYLILAYVLCYAGISHAQLTGIKTVGGSSPDYPTLSAAITDLNNNGVGAGGVIFNVAAGHTETAVNLTITTTTSSAANPIVFQKQGAGNNPLITAGTGSSSTTDGIIKIAGTDYISFNGIDLTDPASNTSANTRMEWGYAILKASASDGTQHVSISNCTITLQKAYDKSTGIYAGNHIVSATTALTVSSISGINSHIDIYSNTITNCHRAIHMTGSSTATYYDDSIRIGTQGMNVITDFGGNALSSNAYGIYLRYFNYAEVLNDSINGGTGVRGDLGGIYIDNSPGSNVLIRNNYVQINFSPTSSNGFGIYCGAGSAGNTVTISDNRVQNCTMSGSSSDWFGIRTASSATLSITGNILSGNTASTSSGDISFIHTTPANPALTINNNTVCSNSVSPGTRGAKGIYAAGTGVFSGNLIFTNAATGSRGHFYSLQTEGGGNIYNNVIYDNKGGSSTSECYGIHTTGGSAEIYQNLVHTLSTAGNGEVQGISLLGGAGVTYNVHRNKIYGLSSSSNSSEVSGIIQSAPSNATIHNNVIGLLTTGSSATSGNGINGIYVSTNNSATVSRLYHNTVFLNATSSGGSNCVFVHSSASVTLSNNLLVNLSANGSTATRSAAVIRRSSNAYTTYDTGSDNNYLFAGTPATNRFLYTDGSTANSFQNLTQYQTYAGNRDQLSLTGLISFLSIAGSSADFLKPADTTTVESNGKFIQGIKGDFLDSLSRLAYPLTGQLNGGGGAPDIGAYELDLVYLDSKGPDISFTPFNKSLAGTGKQLSVTITDPNGVNVAFGSSPRLYFKRSTDANALATANDATADGWKYVESYSTSSPFFFMIDYTLLFQTGFASAGDTIQFFIVAQDNYSLPNMGVHGATFSSAPGSVVLTASQFPVTVTNSYAILSSGIPPFITVGNSGATYTSLTQPGGLFDALNNDLMTNDVTVGITSDLIETGAISLGKFTEEGIGNYRVTIIPGSASNVTISGTVNGKGLINLVDATNVTFDGSQAMGGHLLTFINNSVSGNSAVFHLSGTTDGCSNIAIRNCSIMTDTAYVTTNAGIFVGGSVVGSGTGNQQGVRNRHITLANNRISKCFNGILVNGSPASPADTISITGNEIGSDVPSEYIGCNGIFIKGFRGGNIAGNKVFNIISGYNGTLAGIVLDQNITNTVLSGNRVSDIISTLNSSIPVFGITSRNATVTDVLMKNNVITRILGQGATNDIEVGPVGISLLNGSNYKLINNSITLSGNRLNNSVSNAYTACLYVKNTVTGVTAMNNVMKNVMTSSNSTGPGSNFAIAAGAANANAFTQLNHNLYYTSSVTPGITSALALTGTNVHADLNTWKMFSQRDRQSLWGEPGFLFDSIAEPDASNPDVWNINGRGYPTQDVEVDFYNNARSQHVSTGACDIGAYEVTPVVAPANAVASGAPAPGTTTVYTVALDTVASIYWEPGSTVPTTISVKYYSGTTPPAVNNGDYMNAYWQIDANPSSGLNYTISLNYKPEALRTISTSQLIMAKRDGNAFWTPFTQPSTVVSQGSLRMTVSNLTSFSAFTGTSQNNPLPVRLLDFRGELAGPASRILWSTGSENNCSHFEVEYSYNGSDFALAGTVAASGNSSTLRQYTLDHTVAPDRNAVFYRLKTVDYDNSVSYSNILLLKRQDAPGDHTVVYPNPFSTKLYIRLAESGTTPIEIKDITGKVVFRTLVNGTGTHELNVETLQEGIYFLSKPATGETVKLIRTN